MAKAITCCFTGHRPEKLPWGKNENDPRCVMLKRAIRQALEQAYQDGYRHFISGMARGCDQYFAREVLELRREHDDVMLEAAVPCVEQAHSWSREDKECYRELIARCDMETVVQQNYDKNCMRRRNRYMVNRSDRLIAVYDGAAGGTHYTIGYAMQTGVDVVMIPVEMN